MNAFKQQCTTLRRKNATLPEIMKATGRPKTSVYFHIKDIPLSKEKKEEISEASRKRALMVAKSRKGKSLRSFKKFTEWDKESVLLVSHLLFDGEISSSKCAYSNRNHSLISRVENLMRKVYQYEPNRYANKKTGVCRIGYYNVALTAYLNKKAKELLHNIEKMPIGHQREFVRAFFDDEGCISYEKTKRRIRGYQHNIAILTLVRNLLLNFNIESRINVRGKEIVVSRKSNLKQFAREINFSRGVRVNGKRSNSIWKQSLEKREILRRALASYQ